MVKTIKNFNYPIELVNTLFENRIISFFATISGTLFIIYLLSDFLPPSLLVAFLALQLFFITIRLVSSNLGLKAIKQNDILKTNYYLKQNTIGIIGNSITFGLSGALAIFYATPFEVALLLALAFSLIAGSLATLSYIFSANFFYIVPMLIILALSLLVKGSLLYYFVSFMVIVYLLITIPASFKIFNILVGSIQQRDEIKNLNYALQTNIDTIKQNQSHLVESAKMASLGEMIGNIAHQWRQPLSIINIASSSLRIEHECGILAENSINKYCDNIERNTKFLSDTIDTFRNYIKEEKEYKEVILQDRVDIVLNIVGTALKDKHIKLINNINYNEQININMVVGEFDQIIINIINNAKDALLEKEIEDPFIQIDLYKEDSQVILCIKDNAEGIPKEVLPKIFDPYFTTKENSNGTGLGLYMSKKIIMESLNGELYAQNGKLGAEFIIKLPLDQ